MLELRPHHLLDIIRDYGNDVKRETHKWGASLPEVTKRILNNPEQIVRFVLVADSICETCSMLQGRICQAYINDLISMQEYNDNLDERIFKELSIKPGIELSVIEFLAITKNKNEELLKLFTSPTNNPELRAQGMKNGYQKLGIN